MDLNIIYMYKVIKFFRVKSPYFFKYHVDDDYELDYVDLEVLFHKYLTFNNHIELIIGRAKKSLGFDKRMGGDFSNVHVRYLYITF